MTDDLLVYKDHRVETMKDMTVSGNVGVEGVGYVADSTGTNQDKVPLCLDSSSSPEELFSNRNLAREVGLGGGSRDLDYCI